MHWPHLHFLFCVCECVIFIAITVGVIIKKKLNNVKRVKEHLISIDENFHFSYWFHTKLLFSGVTFLLSILKT